MSRRHRRSDGRFGSEEEAGGGVDGRAPAGANEEPVPASRVIDAHVVSESERLVRMLNAYKQGGGKLGIERVRPTHIRGWLEAIEVPADVGTDWIYDTVHRSWGGGGFRLRPMDRNGNFAPGGLTIEIAGPPMYKGKGYMPDGSVVASTYAQPVAAQQPVHLQPPRPPADNPGVVQALSGLVSTLVAGKGSDQSALLEKQMGELRAAVSNATAPPSSSLGQLNEVVELVKAVRGLDFGGNGNSNDAASGDATEDNPGVPSMPKTPEELMYFAATAWLGRQGQQQQQPQGMWVQGPQGPYWQAFPQQTPFMPGMPGMPMPGAPGQPMPGMPGQPMPGAPGQPMPGAMPGMPMPTPEQIQAFLQWQQQQQQQPPSPPQTQPAPPPTPVAREAQVETADSDDEWEDITPEHVLNHLASLSGDDAATFFDQVGARLPDSAKHALATKLAQQQQAGGVIPMPPTSSPTSSPMGNAYDESKPQHG